MNYIEFNEEKYQQWVDLIILADVLTYNINNDVMIQFSTNMNNNLNHYNMRVACRAIGAKIISYSTVYNQHHQKLFQNFTLNIKKAELFKAFIFYENIPYIDDDEYWSGSDLCNSDSDNDDTDNDDPI